MTNEFTFFLFYKCHYELVDLCIYNTIQSTAVVLPSDAPTVPSLASCHTVPCILSDMVPEVFESFQLPEWQDVPGSSCMCPASDQESAVSAQDPDFSLEVVCRDPNLGAGRAHCY